MQGILVIHKFETIALGDLCNFFWTPSKCHILCFNLLQYHITDMMLR